MSFIGSRIIGALLSDPVAVRWDAKDFFVMTEQASGLSATQRLLLAETTCLQFARAVDRLRWPFVYVAKMEAMFSTNALPFQVISFHSSPRFGSTPRGVLPLL
jgi:hypothetical protein